MLTCLSPPSVFFFFFFFFFFTWVGRNTLGRLQITQMGGNTANDEPRPQKSVKIGGIKHCKQNLCHHGSTHSVTAQGLNTMSWSQDKNPLESGQEPTTLWSWVQNTLKSLFRAKGCTLLIGGVQKKKMLPTGYLIWVHLRFLFRMLFGLGEIHA